MTDLVDGIIRIFESDIKEPVNLGNPIERTVLDFASTVIDLTGGKSSVEHLEARVDDPKRRCPDISKMKKHFGWEPKVDLKEGLSQTIEHFRSVLGS